MAGIDVPPSGSKWFSIVFGDGPKAAAVAALVRRRR
jgi:hypothetical protein